MVHALVAGVGDFPEPYTTEEEQAAGQAVFGPLPAVRDAVDQVARSLQRVGVAPGALLREPDRDALSGAWQDLRRGGPKGESLIVHFAGHGTQPPSGGSLYLVCRGGDTVQDLLDDTCVSFAGLLESAENSGRPVLFMLDVCGAGQAIAQQQLLDLLARRPQDAHRNVWVIAACTADYITYGARFTTAAARVLDRLADGVLDVSPTLKHVPVDTLAAAIDREMALADRAAGQPGHFLVRTPHPQAVLDPQPFLVNPTHSTDPHARLLTGLDAQLREFALSCDPGLDPIHFATRAAGNPHADAIQFSGRSAQLARIAGWIDNTDGNKDPLLVVTGSPGSGKSALLGVTACLTHPDLHPLRRRVRGAVRSFQPQPPGAVLAVHARQLTVEQVTDSLLNQLDRQLTSAPATTADIGQDRDTDQEAQPLPNTPEALLHRMNTVGEALVIVDALDEAADPTAVLDQLLFPLSGAAGGGTRFGCRVMIGTRPWWDTLPALHQQIIRHPHLVLDLDPVTTEDRAILASDLSEYLNQLLDHRYPAQDIQRIADQLARYSDSGAFLVAALYSNHLLASAEGTTADPPRSITEVFDLDRRMLAQANPWIEPVLAILGQARGQGMPLELIHTSALAHASQDAQQPLAPELQDTRRALTEAAFYIRATPDSDHRLLYRYFHQALTDHTATLTDPTTLYAALFGAVPRSGDNTPNWAHAHPYLLRHAADHAAATDFKALDQLLKDPRYLLYAEPDTLTPHLRHAITEQALIHTHIYRTSTAHHPARHQLMARRELLTLDAACWQQPHLAHTFATTTIAHKPALAEPLWATNRTADPALIHILKGHSNWVNAVATTVLQDGTPVAVTASNDRTAIVWDLATGQRIHTLEGHTNSVNAVATTVLRDGTPVAVTASGDGGVIVWSLVTGRRRRTLKGHSKAVNAVATLVLPNGNPIAITASGDGGVAVWNLATGRRRRTLEPISKWAEAVATSVLPNGTPVALTTSNDRTAIVWDLATGRRRRTLEAHTNAVRAVASLVLPDGTPVAVTTSDDRTAIVWDLATGRRRRTLEAHTNAVRAVASMVLPDGTPVAVTTSDDRTAIVWDLATAKRRLALEGHSNWVNGVATSMLHDGTPVAVTASGDRTAIVWDLATGQRIHTLEGHANSVRAVATSVLQDGTPVAATASGDSTAIVWDLATGKRRLAFEGHSNWVNGVATMRLPDSTPVAATTSDDRTAIVWDLATGKRHRTLEGHSNWVNSVATMRLPDSTPVAVTTSADRTAIVWDLATGQRIHTLEGHTNSVRAVATTVLQDGTPVAATAGADRTAIVWDLATGQRIHTLEGHANSVHAVATTVLQDGTPVAVTTSDDRTAIVWDLVTGQLLWRLALPAEGRCVSATRAGFIIGYGREVAHFSWTH
ncbi:AAA family ATPase [Streptomyces sp. HUCO-GS316]|uniref:WD40 repeat domain-containing protein n=1 Tax=Streptomyces sp. HUCO-GS316 TaxID=2692198 RepID=UPI00136F4A02|nr:WD40 repeat domain-containing protein [Streptomyces sp. HUCO-GS316]MXM62109.1 AAA family ATPase [Streptomyces sp. HUCO-GS316]